jgi:hypothetical protein
LPGHNADICYGLIGFNEIEAVAPQYQIIYNIQGWYNFRRYFLGLYPKNSEFYIDECKKYFPNLFFHEGNKITVKPLLSECPQRIILHLTALNDKFRDSQRLGLNNLTQVLEHFSRAARLDEVASLEGSAKSKPEFSFEFINDKGQPEKVRCEAHLKFWVKDRRIYFHAGKANIQNGKILVGHIGRHL